MLSNVEEEGEEKEKEEIKGRGRARRGSLVFWWAVLTVTHTGDELMSDIYNAEDSGEEARDSARAGSPAGGQQVLSGTLTEVLGC